MIRFLRHADAGRRRDWTGPDDRRPLSEHGRRQAREVADRLSPDGVARILTSPALRCVQSVEPLAEATGLPIEIEDCLAEGADPDRVHSLIRGVGPGTVLCSHGDIAAGLLGGLAAEGADLDPGLVWRKGSVWELELNEAGRVEKGRYLPPPA